jgi:hypothetical protein
MSARLTTHLVASVASIIATSWRVPRAARGVARGEKTAKVEINRVVGREIRVLYQQAVVVNWHGVSRG